MGSKNASCIGKHCSVVMCSVVNLTVCNVSHASRSNLALS